MNITDAKLNIEAVAKQRNLFVLISLLLCASIFMLSVRLITIDEKTILVPGLNQEVWTKEGGVSAGYLEETTLMFLPLLLDLSGSTISYKASLVFKYISQSDPVYMQKMREYYVEASKKYKQFNLSTYFAIKNLEINEKNLKVKANGVLTSRYGAEGLQIDKVSYSLQFEWIAGKLRLKEFQHDKVVLNDVEKKEEDIL